MSKGLQITLRFSLVLILILTYLYVTRAKSITGIDQITICCLNDVLMLDSESTKQYISDVEEKRTGDTLQIIVYRKTVSFLQSGPYTYEINLKPGINSIKILDTVLPVREIEKCIE